jgi:hypothetical protein
MVRKLSSKWTFFLKFVFPPLIALIYGGGILAFRYWPPKTRMLWEAAASWAFGVGLVVWVVAPLKRVRLVDNTTLLVSNFRSEIAIPVTEVERVSQDQWLRNGRPITLHLRSETLFGRRVMFIPPLRQQRAFGRESEVVDEVRQLAGIAEPNTG